MGAGSKKRKIARKRRRDDHALYTLINDKWCVRYSIVALCFRGPYRRMWAAFDNERANLKDMRVVPDLLIPWGKRKDAEAIANLLNKEGGDDDS